MGDRASDRLEGWLDDSPIDELNRKACASDPTTRTNQGGSEKSGTTKAGMSPLSPPSRGRRSLGLTGGRQHWGEVLRDSWFPPLPTTSAAALKQEGLKPTDWDEICRRLGREPNRAELGMFGVMWSEHCCYRNSRPLLSGFPTEGPRILVGPGENAGVVDLGGMAIGWPSRSKVTTTPPRSNPFRGQPQGLAASCVTSSPWGPVRSRC